MAINLRAVIIAEARARNQARAGWARPRDSPSANICFLVAKAEEKLANISYDEAYPHLDFLPRSRNWWSWLKGTPAECIHLGERMRLDRDPGAGYRFSARQTAKAATTRCGPEITLCRECLSETAAPEMVEYEGRVIAFEPDPELLDPVFFCREGGFREAGLAPDVADAIAQRLVQNGGACQVCGHAATWLWFSREQVATLDEVEQIAAAPGEAFCAKHGARNCFRRFEKIAEANIFYMNLPYGESGAYVWI